MEVVPVFSGQCSKGVAFSPETRFVTVSFYFRICVFFQVLNFDPPVTRFAVLDIDAENAFTALTFVFLLLFKTICFLQHISGITQPAFSGKNFSINCLF